MTPYQQLAAFDGADGRAPTAAWARTAPVLRAWAAKAGGSYQEQAVVICLHGIRRWSVPALASVPELATYAALFRIAPGVADLAETHRITHAADCKAWAAAASLIRDPAFDETRTAALVAANDAAHAAARSVVWAIVKDTESRLVTYEFWATSAAVGADRVRRLRWIQGDPWLQATEEWILLARPTVPPLYAVLLDPCASPEPDAYAVAWDALAARLDTGDTDDALRIRDGVDASGAPVPTWARRTALARCLVRLEMTR